MTVTFSPTSAGTKSATISISNNDSNEGTYSFNVTANSFTASPEINIQSNGNDILDGSTTYATTNNTEYGTTYIGVTVSKTFTIQNIGTSNLNISSYSITGTNASEFTITTPPSATITPGSSTIMVIRYNATTVGANMNATINVISNDSNEATYNFNIRGTTLNPEIDLEGNSTSITNNDTTPTTIDWTDFGDTDIASGTVTRVFTIRNNGTTPLTITNPTISGTHAGDFTVTVNPTSTSINVGNNRTFTVVFNPSAIGVRNATITITNNDADENPYVFNISGNGTSAEINVRGNSNDIADGATTTSTTNATDFGSTDLNLGTVAVTYTINNTGTTPLLISNPVISGTNASDFIVTTNPAVLSIAAGSSTTFTVTFNPSATGTRVAFISFNTNDSNENPFNYTISGTGTDREIDVQGNSVTIVNGDNTSSVTDWTDFGQTDINVGTVARTFRILNTATTGLTISNPTISGVNASDFTITANPASTGIIGGDFRTFTVTFNPTTTGTKTAIITINNNDFDENPYTFTIQGYGANVEINVTGLGETIVNGDTTPSSTDGTAFGNILLPSGTSSRTFVIQNSGTTPLNISNPIISGINAADFTVTSNPSVLSIPAGGNTSFTVLFSTTNNGQRNAIITVNNDDANENPYVFFINGFGDIDTDGDGITNNVDNDDDNDGITDVIECSTCLSDPFQNGSFENPTIAAGSYAILPTSSVTGWQTSAENFIEIWSSGFNGVPAAAGNQFAELNANIPGILYQTFCLNGAGGTINWSIKHRGRGGVDQAFVKFGSSLTNAIASTPIATMVDDVTAWGTYSGVYTIPVGQTQIVMTFQAGYTGSGSASVGNFIDDVQIVINQNCVDTDGDGVTDVTDVDDENDGIPDIEEAGFKAYSNKKSTMDMSSSTTWMDANGNGMNDYIDSMISGGTYVMINTDGDFRPDYLDLDSDNDTLFDVDEANLLNGDGDINGDGTGDLLDTDRDGLLDLYDNSTAFGTINRDYTQDTDNDGIPNYRDLDSDNNGTFDITTSLYASYDANNDGKIDGVSDNDRDGIMDAFDTNNTIKGSPRNLDRKLFLEFDGRNDYGEASGVLSGLANASLMSWIDLAPGYNAVGVVVGQGNFLIRVSGGRQLQAILNGTTLTYATPLSTSRWYHVAAIYDGSTLKLYLNGSEVATTNISGSLNADTNPLTIGKQPSSAIRYFKGKIDELRIFNVALTPTQLQRMVYQEIQNNSSQVRGAIVPRDIETLPFANLLRYYRMDAYKDDIVDDLTTPAIDVTTGMKIYNNKVIYYQQAPMPFVTRATGTLATAVNDTANDVRGMDVIDYDYSIIRVQHDIKETANHTNMGMFVDNGVTIGMTNDNKLQNDWYLKLDGKIDLVGKSQLVQTTNSELDVTSTGSIERDQQGQSNRFNYNYWSSPVSSINNSTINHGYTVAGVMKDGTNPDSIQNLNWTSGTNSSATSPITLSSYWIYKFQNVGNNYYNWSSVGQNGALLAGQGFTLKGSNAITSDQNYTFVGKPNNGTISTAVGANNLMLAGNPYPSAIDADEFINDNLSTITGTLYFWEHYATNTSHNTIQYQGGYATRNLTGSTAPSAPAIVSGLGSSTKEPGRFIPVGQGFFVAGNATGGTLTFQNDQRLFIKESNVQSNTLFRENNMMNSANPLFDNTEDTFADEQYMKIKLGFKSSNNYYRQVLIGFMNDKATSEIDPGYDAAHLDDKPNDMYFMQNTAKLNIVGDGYFNINNIYPLGVKVAAAGNTTIGIDKKENVDENIEIYIYDNVTSTYNSIKENSFVISLPAGTYEDRFSLRFVDTNSLAVGDVDLQKGISVTNSQANSTINIKNQLMETTIKSVMLFNMIGQQITSWDIENTDQASIELPTNAISTGAYIVKVNTENGSISKKILIK